jgi:SAM-dependent methyltransferase/methyltransferase-like protein
MTSARDDSYDRVPYESHTFAVTHPEHLGAIAKLHGLDAAPPETARVLELGCSSAGNLVPIAARYPDAKVTGLDRSIAQIDRGRRLVARLDLANVTLLHGDIADTHDDLGEFDYIIAHGIYSWVPPHVQRALLGRFARHLAPRGLGFISHNTYPGFYFRRMAREAALFHAPLTEAPDERLTRSVEFVEFLARASATAWREYHGVLGEQARIMRQHPAWFTLHDVLNEECDGVYFHEMAARLAGDGLRFVADAEWHSMQPVDLAADTVSLVESMSDDPLAREQYYDMLRNRVFRQSVVCRADVTVDAAPKAERLGGLWVAGRVPASLTQPEDRALVLNSTHGVRVETRRASTITALRAITAAYPARVSVDDLVARTCRGDPREIAALHGDLLTLTLHGVLALFTRPLTAVSQPGETPTASKVARALAMEGPLVSSLLHAPVRLHPVEADLVRLLDGTRTRADLLAACGETLAAITPADDASAHTPAETLDRLLRSLATQGVLIA